MNDKKSRAGVVIPAKAGIHLLGTLKWIPAFAGMTLSVIAHAEPVKAPLPWNGENVQVEEKEKSGAVATLRRVEDYLNDITSITADFVQIAPDGGLAEGKLYIKRPGKMRWQYSPPTPVLMLSNGETLTYYDYELDQISHMPMDDTLAGFLAQPDIQFDDDALRVVNFREGAGAIRFTILQTNKTDQGTLTLELSSSPMKIENIIITDAVGQVTTVSLKDAKYNLALDDALFRFDNPRSVFEQRYQR